jgi:hypothetical protein
MTVLSLITAALRQIGELTPGQIPNDEEAAAGLQLLNTILANWELARRKVFIIDNLQFPLSAGVNKYTMGPGGDFSSYRPVKIQSANVVFSDDGNPQNGEFHALELVNSVAWAQIRERSLGAQRPLKLYNDNDYPLLALYLWPTPTPRT